MKFGAQQCSCPFNGSLTHSRNKYLSHSVCSVVAVQFRDTHSVATIIAMAQSPATLTTPMTTNYLDHASCSDSARRFIGLDSLPSEILFNILTLVMTSDKPVEIFYITSLRKNQLSGRETPIKWGKKRDWVMEESNRGRLKRPSTALMLASGTALRPMQGLDPGNTATAANDAVKEYPADLPQSLQELFNKLNPQSVEHIFDWLCVTQTCTRFRALGLQTFFLQKTFVISPPTLLKLADGLLDGFLPCFTAYYQEVAVEHIRHVIVPASGSADIIRLPRYRLLPRLRKLDILLSASDSNGQISVRDGVVWRESTAEIIEFLRELGLTLDEFAVRFAH